MKIDTDQLKEFITTTLGVVIIIIIVSLTAVVMLAR
jgi:hypothetical protein